MIDLTKGKPIKVILLFTFPLLLGNYSSFFIILLTPLSSADTRQGCFAAVGATSALNFLIMDLQSDYQWFLHHHLPALRCK